jgi:hypothetical protein
MRALAPGLSARRGDVCLLTRAPQERVTAQIDAGPDPRRLCRLRVWNCGQRSSLVVMLNRAIAQPGDAATGTMTHSFVWLPGC